MMINDYIKQLEQVNNKKFSIDQSVNLFYGIVFNLIGDKKIFTKNIYINDFLIKTLSIEYKEYLFSSRPYLASRVLNDIKKEKSYIEIVMLSEKIIMFLETKNIKEISGDVENKNKSPKKHRIETNTVGWIDHIRGDKKGNN